MRRANGSGSIFKIKGARRRKPWRVRVTRGWDIIETTEKCRQDVVTLGYYATRQEAEAALAAYHECPYDIKAKDITFEEVYKKWSEGYFEKLSSKSSERTIICAYRYCHSIYRMRMRDIRTYHLQDCMDHAYIIPDSGKDKGQKSVATRFS